MKLETLDVQNLGCIRSASIPCDALTALVGANGCGKSTFLRALELFYSESPKLSASDFFGAEGDSRDIEISLTFVDLEGPAREVFESYLEGGRLRVLRVLSTRSREMHGRYFGFSLQFEPFAQIRHLPAAELRKRYGELREQPDFQDLPPWTNQEAGRQALAAWEAAHPDKCKRTRDDGQFFGFTNVAKGRLNRFTRFVLVPAVREASADAADGRGSAIAELMDLVVRSALARRADLREFESRVRAEYGALVDPSNLPELASLEGQLNDSLKQLVSTAGVTLDWLPLESLEVPLPKTLVRLVEDNFSGPVERSGHGLQRAFLVSLFQHLAAARASGNRNDAEAGGEKVGEGKDTKLAELSHLLVGIEEPELYQHPNRQRHFAKILRSVTRGEIPGVAVTTQIIYGTHSPHFVGLDRFNQVRLVRKAVVGTATHAESQAVWKSLDDIAGELWELTGRQGARFTADTLKYRLQAIFSPWMNEGFFAKVVVLVEGESDRAAVLGTAAFLGADLEEVGVAVLPVGGKANLDRPFLIFRALGIPCYLVWDNDADAPEPNDAEVNRRLLRALGAQEEDWPVLCTSVATCLAGKLENVLAFELGAEIWERRLPEVLAEYGLAGRADGMKNPAVVNRLLQVATEAGVRSRTLEECVGHIRALAEAST